MTSSEAERSRAEIRPTKERVELDLLARPDVTGVDINYKTTKGRMTDRMAIVVSVKKKKSKSSLKADELIPKEIDGIPTDVIEEEIVLHRPALAEVETQIDKSTYATLEGGISMGPCRSVYLEPPDVPTAGYYIFVGTLGVFVRDRTSHDVMALTNFHVACIDTGWKVGDKMTQPGRVDGGSCPAGQFGTLQRAVLSGHVDGAVVGLDAGKSWKCAIAEIGSVQGKMAASVGMAVRKRGRTTELTYGKVTSVDYSTSIDYGDGLGTHVLKEQIRVDVDTAKSTQFGDHGDSGSAVVEGGNHVVGLHFAGNKSGTMGVANPIQSVLDELNVDLCSGFSIVTTPIVCRPLVTRPVFCNVLTRPQVCAVVSQPWVCGFEPLQTRACGDPPFERFPPREIGPFNPRDIGPFNPRDLYGTPGADQADDLYWQGYAAALEAVKEAEEEAKRE